MKEEIMFEIWSTLYTKKDLDQVMKWWFSLSELQRKVLLGDF